MDKRKNISTKWKYIDEVGTFEWENPHAINQLYFPLCNEAGMMSSVTPRLNGDAKTGQNSFLSLPVSIEDLHNNRSSRNFWVYNGNLGAYSITGNSAKQISERFTENEKSDMVVKGTFLAHTLTRKDSKAGIKSEIITFCPAAEDTVELMWVKITNTSNADISLTPTTAIPIFGRSADNIRDHRHATSLMHRMMLYDHGLSIKPTIHHDERGHEPNETLYFVLAAGGNGEKPVGQFPTVREFIGEGGSFDWPQAVVQNTEPYKVPPNRRDGMEAIGAIRFSNINLAPGQTREYIVICGITNEEDTISRCIDRYGDSNKIRKALADNEAFWRHKVEAVTFGTGNSDLDRWMRWTALQPVLRKVLGCSFLPHHDYGRGGRGWRDLWQDYLALLLQSPEDAREILISNSAGIRADGSNATIILKGAGNFTADRNKISRVWMDHGVWPYYTIKLYIDQTGDMDILFEENTYWKDHQIRRAKARDNNWRPSEGNLQKTASGDVYRGSVFEHLLLQHLVCFHNVGGYNNMKLEDGDWNDQLDMAPDRGESVPFTAFYGWNLISMAELLLKYKELRSVNTVKLCRELTILTGLDEKMDYAQPGGKRERLGRYFDAIENGLSGGKADVNIDRLAKDLKEKGKSALEHVREKEWIESDTGYSFFNGYYNNDGERVDGDHDGSVRMNLTAQTFAIMSGAADNEQALRAYHAAQAVLKDPNTGGYRLTTPLGPNTWNFGRGFALIYGEKETGAMFSHMAVMFMNALYGRNFVRQGYEVFTTIYNLCTDTEKAQIYPGIPEYITHEGRGMYHYVTGSASWLLLTMLTQVFGVRGEMGDLILNPKLVAEQFDDTGNAAVRAVFAGKQLEILYMNPDHLEYEDYLIKRVIVNGLEMKIPAGQKEVKICKSNFHNIFKEPKNRILILLS